MANTLTVYRGLRTPDKSTLVKHLGLQNDGYEGKVLLPVRGVFFRGSKTSPADPNWEGGKIYAERYARFEAMSTVDHTIPAVVEANITPDKLPLLKGRIWMAQGGPGGPYQEITDISQLPQDMNNVVIDFDKLRPEVLAQLGIRIGFPRLIGRGFTYKSYADWAKKYGIKIDTREGALPEPGAEMARFLDATNGREPVVKGVPRGTREHQPLREPTREGKGPRFT